MLQSENCGLLLYIHKYAYRILTHRLRNCGTLLVNAIVKNYRVFHSSGVILSDSGISICESWKNTLQVPCQILCEAGDVG